MARAACICLDAALAKNLPHRSREHEFTDGRAYGVKDRDVLYGFGRVIDPHGSLYNSLINWIAWNEKYLKDVPIVPIDLRQNDWTIAYNVMRPRTVADPSVLISNFVQAMSYVWGADGIQNTPLFGRLAKEVLWPVYEKKMTLPFRVLIVLKSAERRNNTAERLLQNNPPILTQAWLTTFDEVTADPLGTIWIRPQDYREAVNGTQFEKECIKPTFEYRRQAEREMFVEEKIKKRKLIPRTACKTPRSPLGP